MRSLHTYLLLSLFFLVFLWNPGQALSAPDELLLEELLAVLASAQKSGDRAVELDALIRLGRCCWNLGEMNESAAFYSKALAQASMFFPERRKGIEDCLEVDRLYKEGKDFRSRENFAEAVALFERAVSLAQDIQSRDHQVKCLRQLGVTHWLMENYPAFFEASSQALRLARETGHHIEEARCLYNIGLYYSTMDEYSLALNHYKQALKIFEEADSPAVSDCLTNISDIYIQVGDYDKALDYLGEVLRIDRLLEDLMYEAMDLNNIGVVYRKKALESKEEKDWLDALKNLEASLRLSRQVRDKKTEMQCLNNLGTVYTDMKDYPAALARLRHGLEMAENLEDDEEAAAFCINIGIVCFHQEEYETAIQSFQRAIRLAHDLGKENLLWEAYYKAADALKEQKMYSQALDSYKKSISIIENIRSKIQLEELKASFLGSDERVHVYHNLIDLFYCMSGKKEDFLPVAEAFHFMERAKARSFLDRMELSQIDRWMSVDPELVGQEAALLKRIAGINTRLIKSGTSQEERQGLLNQMKRCEEDLDILKRRIRLINPAYADLKYSSTVTLQEAQGCLGDESTAFFAYCLGEKKSYAFVLTRDSIEIFPLPPTEWIRSTVRQYLQVITDKDSQNFNLGYELFQSLVLPGMKPGLDRIIFVPDDILHYLPFESLTTQQGNPRWLIRDHLVSYAPSITAFREIQLRQRAVQRSAKKDILSFGNPHLGEHEGPHGNETLMTQQDTRDDFRLSRLDFSQMEVEKIAVLFRKSRRDIYTGEMATEGRLKKANLSDYKVVHFATHGLIDNRFPARSSIVLSLNNPFPEDGFLQMREVLGLNIQSDLVVLSACQTGLGRFIKGEGIEGISRAFLFAGASSVLMTLWAVNDQASYQFMHRFYTHLRSAEPVEGALRRAKLEMIDSKFLSHPFYWAGFVVSGAGDKVLFSRSRRNWVYPFLAFVFVLGFLVFKPLHKIRIKD